MFSRKDLKTRAKTGLKKYYFMAFIISLVVKMVNGAYNTMSSAGSAAADAGAGTETGWQLDQGLFGILMDLDMSLSQLLKQMNWQLFMSVLSAVAASFLLILALRLLFQIFVGNVMTVGAVRFYMESREMEASAGFNKVLYGFTGGIRGGRYRNLVKAMFFRQLYIFLWSLLLVVPGVIRAYEYRMVPYILSENPEMAWKDALQLSKKMMDGRKWEFFMLQLSFIGWYLLGSLAFGVGRSLVDPYAEATYAEFYAGVRELSGEVGGKLPGYGVKKPSNRFSWDPTTKLEDRK